MAEALSEEGCLFVNGDIEGLGAIIERCRARVVTVGESEGCDWQLARVMPDGRGQNLKSFRRREIGTEYTVSACWAVITPRMLRSPWRFRRNWA